LKITSQTRKNLKKLINFIFENFKKLGKKIKKLSLECEKIYKLTPPKEAPLYFLVSFLVSQKENF
jgi:Leucine-rich repeat (LRR) protein